MKDQEMTVPFPINMNWEHEYKYFKGKNEVTFSEDRVRELKSVFVSAEGLCVKNGLFIPRSAFNMIGSEDNTHFFEMWKLATEQYFVCHYGKSLTMEKLEGRYLLAHTKWFNFYFWLSSSLYRIISTEHLHESVELLMPEQVYRYQFVKDSLLMFPKLKIKIIPSGLHLKVSNLVFPEVRKWTVSFSPTAIKLVRDKVLGYAKSHYKVDPGIGEKIYLSRRKTGKRAFTNQEEVEKIAVEAGFSLVCFEDYNLYEQALIMSEAKFLMGQHGAGFGNMIYMKESSITFELLTQPPKIEDHRTGYWRLSGILGFKHLVQLCKLHIDPTVFDILNNDIEVDIELFKKNIKMMLAQ